MRGLTGRSSSLFTMKVLIPLIGILIVFFLDSELKQARREDH